MSEFEIQLSLLRYCGFWECKTKLQEKFLYSYRVFAIFVTLYNMIGESIYIYQNRKDIYAVADLIAPIIVKVTLVIKISSFWLFSDELLALIDDIKELNGKWHKYTDSIKFANKFDQLFSWIYVRNCLFTSFCYAMIPIVKDFINYWIYGMSSASEMPFNAVFLYDTSKSPMYEVSYSLFIFGLWFAALVHALVDGTYLGLTAYICSFFDILREMIHECEMKEFVVYHRKILNFVDRLNKIYKVIAFGEYLMLGLCICVLEFQLVMLEDPVKLIIALSFILVALIQLFLYSYSGQLIMDKSMDVCKEVYILDKDYLCIMMRSQSEAKIEAGLFHADLETFTSIVNSAGSMLTLLKSYV